MADSRRRRAHLVDPRSGAYVEVLVPVEERSGRRFVMTGQEGASWLAKQDLSGPAYRVLWHLVAVLDFDNWIKVTQASVVAELGMSQPAVSRVFTELEAAGVLLRGPRSGKSSTWRLDPGLMWKGKPHRRRAAVEEALRARGMRVVGEPAG